MSGESSSCVLRCRILAHLPTYPVVWLVHLARCCLVQAAVVAASPGHQVEDGQPGRIPIGECCIQFDVREIDDFLWEDVGVC